MEKRLCVWCHFFIMYIGFGLFWHQQTPLYGQVIKDLGTTLDHTEWNDIWLTVSKCSFNILVQENAYKLVSLWYMIPDHISRSAFRVAMTNVVSCKSGGPASRLTTFRYKFIIYFSWFYILTSPMTHVKPYYISLYCTLINIRESCQDFWRQPSNFAKVKQRLMGTIILVKLTSIIPNTHTKQLKVWGPWLDYNAQPHLDCSLLSL